MRIKKPVINGFTMVELLITMIIITILSSAFIPNFLDLSRKRADLVVSELWTIAQAIQTYDTQTGSFPGGASCTNAIETLVAQQFIAGVTTTITPWGSNAKYTTTCNASQTLLKLSITNISTKWRPYIANALPASTYDTTGEVTINIPKLAYIPVLKRFLYLDPSASHTLSSSGTYLTQGDINVATSTDIVLLGRQVNSANAALSQAVFYQDLVSIPPTATITKPTCPTPTIPHIVTALNAVSAVPNPTPSDSPLPIAMNAVKFNTSTATTTTSAVTSTTTPITLTAAATFASTGWAIKTSSDTVQWFVNIASTSPGLIIINAEALISVKCQRMRP